MRQEQDLLLHVRQDTASQGAEVGGLGERFPDSVEVHRELCLTPLLLQAQIGIVEILWWHLHTCRSVACQPRPLCGASLHLTLSQGLVSELLEFLPRHRE